MVTRQCFLRREETSNIIQTLKHKQEKMKVPVVKFVVFQPFYLEFCTSAGRHLPICYVACLKLSVA